MNNSAHYRLGAGVGITRNEDAFQSGKLGQQPVPVFAVPVGIDGADFPDYIFAITDDESIDKLGERQRVDRAGSASNNQRVGSGAGSAVPG